MYIHELHELLHCVVPIGESSQLILAYYPLHAVFYSTMCTCIHTDIHVGAICAGNMCGHTMAFSDERLPPKPPAPTMNVENWLTASSSPSSDLVSTEEGKEDREERGHFVHLW